MTVSLTVTVYGLLNTRPAPGRDLPVLITDQVEMHDGPDRFQPRTFTTLDEATAERDRMAREFPEAAFAVVTLTGVLA